MINHGTSTGLRAGLLAIAMTTPGCLGSVTTSGGSGSGPTTATQAAVDSVCGKSYDPGHYALRRLTNTEYTNTVQDLLFTAQTPGSMFEGSSPGPSGFSNDSTVLTLSSPLVLQYYTAAESLAAEVIASKGKAGGAYSKIVTCTTTDTTCATQAITAFAKRAFRRPATAAELDAKTGLMSVYAAGATTSFDQGISDTIVSVLLNPNFLMIPVVNDKSTDPNAVFALDNYQLASRLAYDLWQTMPDDELLAAADAGTLTDATTLTQQVTRMLADPTRTVALKNTLRDEYAQLGPLATTDFTAIHSTNDLRDSMIGETDAFLADLINNNRSPLSILNAGTSFVNKQLADFYGVAFTGSDPTAFVSANTGRVGLGSQASVLANTSGGDPAATNPIKRGHWITDQLYCTPPPPPPNVVPALQPPATPVSTIRDQLKVHTTDPACAGCHINMDAFGLGAEDYDILGKTRTNYANGTAIDASGAFPGGGTSWTTSTQMYTDMATEPKALACIPQQLMSYVLSRNSNSSDDTCVAGQLAATSVTDTGTFADLMTGIVTSRQFLFQTGEAQ